VHLQKPPLTAPELLQQQRLAEAANYAVLRRIAPVLQHNVAGFMQPVSMLTTVLQRRVRMTNPDMQAVTQNLTTISALMKEATTGCMNAVGWMVSSGDVPVSLHSSVNEAIQLLGLEFSETELELINAISDENAVAPRSFLRSLLMGALLAFCDQRSAGSALQVTLETGGPTDRLLLRMLPGDPCKSPASTDTDRKSRTIDWPDVQAMADSFNVAMERGEGWLTLGVPKSN
jgi:hypothetical protein